MLALQALTKAQLAAGRQPQQLHPYPDRTSEMCHSKLSATVNGELSLKKIAPLIMKNTHANLKFSPCISQDRLANSRNTC